MTHFASLSGVKPKAYPGKGPVTLVRAKLVIEHLDKDGEICREKVLIQGQKHLSKGEDPFKAEHTFIDKLYR